MPRRYPATDIAAYFLAKQDEDAGDQISNLKLQKLCYYAQGVALATRGEPLFDENVEAWLHGPVVPQLYRQYREFGSGGIPPVGGFDPQSLDAADRMVLDDVHTFYGQFSAWRLRQMTHDEAPWKSAYKADCNMTISHEALAAHFTADVDEGYRAKYAALQGG